MNLSKSKIKKIRDEFEALQSRIARQDAENMAFLQTLSPELRYALEQHWYADDQAVYGEVRRSSVHHILNYLEITPDPNDTRV